MLIPELLCQPKLEEKFEKTLVTPETAKFWLERGNVRNRKISENTVRKYVTDMLKDRWRFVPDAITFASDGTLLNGQHRLTAIVRSGKSVWLLVATNVAHDAMLAMDQGLGRRLYDVAKVSGTDLSRKETECAEAMCRGRAVRLDITKQEKLDFARRYADAIRFSVTSYTPKRGRGLDRGEIYAVIARARVCHPLAGSTIARFAQILAHGAVEDMSPLDVMVCRLRDSLTPTITQTERYDRTAYTLRAFMSGRAVKLIRSVPTEMFPLPEDKRGKVKEIANAG